MVGFTHLDDRVARFDEAIPFLRQLFQFEGMVFAGRRKLLRDTLL
jgi:hypothetical protein